MLKFSFKNNDYSERNLSLSINKRIKKITFLTALLSVTACNTNLKNLPEIDDIPVPDSWQTSTQATTTDHSVKVQPPKKEPEKKVVREVNNGWLKSFNDPELNQYVAVALEKNPNLLDSAAQLKSAIRQVTIAGSNLWPSLRANLNNNRTTVEGQALSELSDLNDTAGVTTEIRTVRTTLDVSWEADVWGKLTQQKKAAAYSAKAQAELFKDAELSLVANVSRAWYNAVTNKLQLDLAFQRLDSFKSTASLIEENYKNGISSALDVYLSRSDVQQQIASLSDARVEYIETLRAFKTLLGEYPSDNLEFNAKLPELNEPVPTGLPAQLLTRRPDIKASQLNYKSQIASANPIFGAISTDPDISWISASSLFCERYFLREFG